MPLVTRKMVSYSSQRHGGLPRPLGAAQTIRWFPARFVYAHYANDTENVIMKPIFIIALIAIFVGCSKSSEPTASIVGTWDWRSDAYKNGTITIQSESPLSGYLYSYSVRYDFSGTYDATGAHINIVVNGRTAFGATVSSDKKSMSGTYTEIGNYQYPQSYPFTATKR